MIWPVNNKPCSSVMAQRHVIGIKVEPLPNTELSDYEETDPESIAVLINERKEDGTTKYWCGKISDTIYSPDEGGFYLQVANINEGNLITYSHASLIAVGVMDQLRAHVPCHLESVKEGCVVQASQPFLIYYVEGLQGMDIDIRDIEVGSYKHKTVLLHEGTWLFFNQRYESIDNGLRLKRE